MDCCCDRRPFGIPLLGAIASNGPEIKFNIGDSGANVVVQFAGQTIYSTGGGLNSDVAAWIIGSATFFVIAALVMAVVYFVLGSIIRSDTCGLIWIWLTGRMNPRLERCLSFSPSGKPLPQPSSCKAYPRSCGFIIPGIVAGYSYAMTSYILAENPELTASDAIEQSKQMMYGHRFQLFCLQLSLSAGIFLPHWRLVSAIFG